MSCKIYEKQTNIYYDLPIDEIIQLIKNDPQKTYYKCINNEKTQICNDFVLKTQFICHRINTIDELQLVPNCFGTEIDIRDDNLCDELILAHDPYSNGIKLSVYLQEYAKKNMEGTLILNIKSERIELECLQQLKKYNINNFFFLDSSFPMIYSLNKNHNTNKFACRFSEWEPIENFLAITHMVTFVWVDCFTKQPLTVDIFNQISQAHKKICIVSPELQSQNEKLKEYRNYFIQNHIIPDSICCKMHNIIHWL